MGLSEPLFILFWREAPGLHLFDYLRPFTQAMDFGTTAGEDILWTDLAFFFFWLEEPKLASGFLTNVSFRMWV